MNAAANLHAIWLDDLAPGEGSTPIWDALYAEQDAETQRVVFNACADEHTEPVAVVRVESPLWVPTSRHLIRGVTSVPQPGVQRGRVVATTPEPAPKRKKPAKKPAKPKSPLAAQEAKLRTVRGRLADEFKTLGGGDAGEVNELGVAFACLLGLLLAPVLIAVFG